MKEKNILYLMAIMFFILFSTLTVLFLESKILQQEMSFYWENEQIITRLFQEYHNNNNNQKSLDEIIENEYSNIISLGFYNYYGDLLYAYGDSREKLIKLTRPMTIDKKSSTVMIERDLLSPFDPLKRTFDNKDDDNNKDVAPRSEWNYNDKQHRIRYVTIDAYDDIISLYKIKFRIIQVLTVTLIFILFLFFVFIYIKNMSYRNHIESTERLVVLGTAARTLTHEIKNPLSIIRLQSSIIKRSGCDKHASSLTIINDEISRITELTERVTDYLRHPKGYPEKLNVNRTLTTYFNNKEQNITLNLPEKEKIILIDKNRFTSIIDNITNNAIESGSPIESIFVNVTSINNKILFEISDKGKGISKDDLNKLLDPFYTTKSKGSGLGLSIVSSYVNAVDGTIKIESEPLKGTTVTIVIPLYKMVKEA